MPIVFGLSDFSSFTARSAKTSPFNDTPIILVEGIKDALYLKRFYPYTLALLTNYASDPTCEFISRLSRQIIISMDSDTFGRKAMKKLSQKFLDLGSTAIQLHVPGTGNLKDWGMGFSDKNADKMNFLRIRSSLARFGVEISPT